AYYKRNYPRAPYADIALPIVQPPVLLIHGLDDPFLLAAALDRTWEWVAQPLTLVTIPGAGHFVQQDASALGTKTLKRWLAGEGRRGEGGRCGGAARGEGVDPGPPCSVRRPPSIVPPCRTLPHWRAACRAIASSRRRRAPSPWPRRPTRASPS